MNGRKVSEMGEKFETEIKQCKIYLKPHKKAFTLVGYLKLLGVVTFGISLYLTIHSGLTWRSDSVHEFPTRLSLLTGLLLILLICLWIYQRQLNHKIKFYEALIKINQAYLDRISGDWIHFPDTGQEFEDIYHPYALDLDMVGKNSLFQLLNVTHTWHGRQAFAKDLLGATYTKEEILKRQEAITELSKDVSYTNTLQYHLSKISSKVKVLDLLNLIRNEKLVIQSKWLKNLLTYLPFFTIFMGIISAFSPLKPFYLVTMGFITLQALICFLSFTQTRTYLAAISKIDYQLEYYLEPLENLENKGFKSLKLQEIQNTLVGSEHSAKAAIKGLASVMNWVSMRNHGVIYLVLNILFLWDYRCLFKLEKWKVTYGSASESWFLSLGEFESLMSFAGLPNICNHTTLPTFSEEKNYIEATDLGHPLISNATRVTNSMVSKNQIHIISGSNMSGKTTFLRTLGINIILAQTGSFVCATTLRQTFFSPVTSMRLSDDLNEGISTFYAELKRIKLIMDLAKEKENTLFLIDEIFRGTNSVDRLFGAKEVLSQLNELGVSGLITTHDLDLCHLSDDQKRFTNYSFSEQYKDGKIQFDYKLKEGPSTTTNAKYLMEMLGLLK